MRTVATEPRIEISTSLAPEVRGPIAEIVRWGLATVAGRWAPATEVHVRAAPARRRWRVRAASGSSRSFPLRRDAIAFANRYGGELRVEDRVAQPWVSGRTYDGVPPIARVGPGTRWLVTLKVPIRRDGHPPPRYPRRWHYAPYVTAPVVEIRSWQEEVLHAAAHEARHVRQFAERAPLSEVDAERAAAAALETWRARWDPAGAAGSVLPAGGQARTDPAGRPVLFDPTGFDRPRPPLTP